MSDPVNNARSARERLAQALAALQQPGVPTALLGVAEPVAQAMSGLHQIEASGGAQRLQAAPGALDAVRRALSSLQADRSGHPAVAQAIEAVAGSLGLVHGLTVAGPAPAAAGAPRPAPAAAAVPLGLAGTMVADGMPGGPTTIPAQAPQAAHAAAPPAVQWQAPPQPHAPPAPVAAHAPIPASGVIKVAAELGVHSVTNFYKGLSGNDIIDSGGIFIATYQIPPIGRELLIHVTMPGGYEFEAKGIVRWTREAPLSGSAGVDAPPGFGAQFVQIAPEARQLVYRYVRNREPLFHDDL